MDDAYADEISNNLLNEIINDSLEPILNENSIILKKLQNIFFNNKEIAQNERINENIFFSFEENEKTENNGFRIKHINDLLRMIYNFLVSMVLGI